MFGSQPGRDYPVGDEEDYTSLQSAQKRDRKKKKKTQDDEEDGADVESNVLWKPVALCARSFWFLQHQTKWNAFSVCSCFQK